MIKIEKVDISGWEAAVRGCRNSWASWNKSDSVFQHGDGDGHDICGNIFPVPDGANYYALGPEDLKLMKTLANANRGSERKFLRYITVTCDVTAPLYWWKEADTYKVGTVTNSTSTMHSICDEEFAMDDFSHEHLYHKYDGEFFMSGYHIKINDYIHSDDLLALIIEHLNKCRSGYLGETDPVRRKEYWWQIIQLLPASYNQKRTVLLNYEVLSTQYKDRRNHRLDEWHTYCDWITSLPYSELITGKD